MNSHELADGFELFSPHPLWVTSLYLGLPPCCLPGAQETSLCILHFLFPWSSGDHCFRIVFKNTEGETFLRDPHSRSGGGRECVTSKEELGDLIVFKTSLGSGGSLEEGQELAEGVKDLWLQAPPA